MALDLADGKARTAQYKVIVAREQYQLDVTKRYGDSTTAQRLHAQLAIDEPRYSLARRQSVELRSDAKKIAQCTPLVATAVLKSIMRRSLTRSLLVANEDLRADKMAAARAWARNDSYPSDESEADLLQARADVAADKALIKRLNASVARLQ